MGVYGGGWVKVRRVCIVAQTACVVTVVKR